MESRRISRYCPCSAAGQYLATFTSSPLDMYQVLFRVATDILLRTQIMSSVSSVQQVTASAMTPPTVVDNGIKNYECYPAVNRLNSNAIDWVAMKYLNLKIVYYRCCSYKFMIKLNNCIYYIL